MARLAVSLFLSLEPRNGEHYPVIGGAISSKVSDLGDLTRIRLIHTPQEPGQFSFTSK